MLTSRLGLHNSNANLKIRQYLRLHMKILCQRFDKNTFYFLRYAHVRYKFSLQTFRNNRMLKGSLFLHLQPSRANNSIIFRTENPKFSGYCFIQAQKRLI